MEEEDEDERAFVFRSPTYATTTTAKNNSDDEQDPHESGHSSK